MKVSYNWLKEFIDFDLTPPQLGNIITLAGLEVEEITKIGNDLDGVVLGEILTCEKHPNADRLHVCTVNAGDAVYPVVCGAPNVSNGQKIAFAKVGTILPIKTPDGEFLALKKTKIRGEISEGMICAEDELGIGLDHSGIITFNTNKPIGTPITELINIYSDYQLEVAITPNRPDATCHLGIARDIAAILNKKLKKPYSSQAADKNSPDLKDFIDISILNPEKCHRYVGMMIKDVTISDSPAWLKDRLTAIGLRPVNNVVDVSNYVLHELGQPLHTFDYDLITCKKIIIQDFLHSIDFITLDNIKRNVPTGTLFICDGAKPVAIAGVMGGLNSEINPNTKNIFIESAYFEPAGIRRSSKTLGIQTDSSYRFERGVDPCITYVAARRCAELIVQIAGGSIVNGVTDVNPVVTKNKKITLNLDYVNRVLGTSFKLNQITATLKGLEIDVNNTSDGSVECTIPTFRPDITLQIDLVEEIARIYDYNKIPNPGKIQFSRPDLLPEREIIHNKLMNAAKSMGFNEIYGNSLIPDSVAKLFADDDVLIKTLNPVSKDTTILRPSLAPGFFRAAKYNFNRDSKGIRFFECGNIFQYSKKGTYHNGVFEETRILLGIGGLKLDQHWSQSENVYTLNDIKSFVYGFIKQTNLVDSLSFKVTNDENLYVLIGNTEIGFIYPNCSFATNYFNINQHMYYAELSVDKILNLISNAPPLKYKPVPKFPGIEFDLAVVVNKELESGIIIEEISRIAGKKLRKINIFDVFEGKSLASNEKSLAFRLFFLDVTKTLTIKDVDTIISKVLYSLKEKFNAKLRS